MKRIIALFCIILLVLTLGWTVAFAETSEQTQKNTVAGENLPAGGKKILDWDTYYEHAAANSGTYCTVSKVTDGSGLYKKYIQTTVKSACKPNQCSLNFDDSSTKQYGLYGNVATGDTVLLHIVARASDIAEGAFYIAMLDADKNSAGSTVTYSVENNWTEFYIPITAAAAATRIYLRIGQQEVQNIEVALFEVYNYGTAQPEFMRFDLEKYVVLPEGGTSVLGWDTYYTNAAANSAKYCAVEKVTNGSGKYAKFVRTQVTASCSTNQCSLNFKDSDGTLGLNGKVKEGDVLLLHFIARGASQEGDAANYYIQLLDSTTTISAGKTSSRSLSENWTEVYIPVTATEAMGALYLRIGQSTLQYVDIAYMEVINYKNTVAANDLPDRAIDLEAGEKSEVIEGQTVNFLNTFSGGTVETGLTAYPNAKTFKNYSHTFTTQAVGDIAKDDVLMFSLIVKANSACTPLDVSISADTAASMTYYVPVQWTEIRIPVQASGLSKIKLVADSKIMIASARFENHGEVDVLALGQKSGMYLLEEFSYYALSENGAGAGRSIDMVKNGNFVYTIGEATLTVTDVSDINAPVVRGKLSGLGANIRQIALCESGEDVMVTSRESGAYFINVTDPDRPYIRSTFNTLEMGNGATIEGHYAYISNREYGVQIVDISDLDHPKQVSVVENHGAVQSCEILDGVLYCGDWTENKITMYDISDPNQPVYLGACALNGRGDGLSVLKVGEKTYVYAATGQHTDPSVANLSPLTVLEYGQGNGLDIFDVTDPTDPKWVSTTKIDGRYYYATYDYWETHISRADNGHLYVYLVSTFNGVYVFDVEDPAAPLRLAHIDVPIATDSANYTYYSSSSRTYVFPFDQSKGSRSPIGACVVEDGIIYMAGVLTDLHIYRNDTLFFDTVETEDTIKVGAPDGSYYDFDGTGLTGYQRFVTEGQVNGVVASGEYLYLACGGEGIVILDRQMRRVATYATDGICYQVAIYKNMLYAAEGDNGLTAYALDGSKLTKQWNYTTENGTVRSVTLSPKGRFAVIQAAARYGEIISTETRQRVINQKSGAQMYYRNVSPLIAGRYIAFWGYGSGGVWWYDFGVNDDYQKPKQITKISGTHRMAMQGGIADYNGQVLATSATGYILYDPATVGSATTGLTNYKDSSCATKGLPTIYDDLMIVCDRMYGEIYLVDITHIAKPKVLQTISIVGNPDIALVSGDKIYIPAGYQGLIAMDVRPFTAQTGHSYDDVCDAICNECDYVRTDIHRYDNACDAGCNECDFERTVEGHKYDNDCDAICNICDFERTVEGHKYDNACDAICNNCDFVRTVGGHKYDNACDTTCNICGATRTAGHTPDWQTVTAATYLKEGLEKQCCTVCGKELNSRTVDVLQGVDVAKVFTDIKTTDWFYKNDSIYYVYNAGLFKGMTETEFKPATAMNRGMFVTVLGRLHGVNADNITYKNTFSDVADGKYYSRYVIWAADNGIVTGTSATTFAPSKNVTREQICAMMVRYCNYADIELKAENAAINFSDAGSISNYAKTAVTTCQRAGLVSGKGDNRFDPKGNAKRSEVATILLNFAKNYL